jgi:hypothetical protein
MEGTAKEEILIEMEKCKNSPYYFCTTYITLTDYEGRKIPFTTPYTEEEFNKLFQTT